MNLLIVGLLLCGCPRAEDAQAPGVEGRGTAEAGTETLPETSGSVATEIVLEPAVELLCTVTPGEERIWRLVVPPGQYVELTLEQRGVDVLARVEDEGGETLVVSDRPTDDQGEESLVFLVPADVGGVRLELEAWEGGMPGEILLRADAVRPASPADRERARAAWLFSRAEELSWQASSGEEKAAVIAAYEAALDAWRRLGDVFRVAETHERLGRVHGAVGQWARAAEHHERAAELFARVEHPRWQAISLHHLGLDLFRLGRPGEAIEPFRAALPLRRRAGDRRGEAITWNSLAHSHQVRDEIQQALDAYDRALELLDEERDPFVRAFSMHNLGVLYASLGDHARAERHLEAAAAAWRRLGDEMREAGSLNQLGELRLERGDSLDAAEDAFRLSLDLRRRAEDRRGEASTLANLGRVAQARREHDEARLLYEASRDILSGLGRPRSEARVLLHMGSLAIEEDRADVALGLLRRAAELYRRTGDLTGEAEALSAQARAERSRGRLHAALAASSGSVELFERVRPRALSLDLRARYFAGVQENYEVHVGVLLELHRREPGAGHDVSAFLAAERARSRALLDLLRQREDRLPAEADPTLLEREAELTHRLARLDRQRLLRADRPEPGKRLSELESEISVLLDELDDLRSSLVAKDPSLRRLERPDPASWPEIRQALDAGSVLLRYWLAEEESVLWMLTGDGLETHRLGPRRLIEAKALRGHGLLARSHRRETRPSLRSTLCELSGILLRPVAERLGDAPLVIVPDGALHYLPFAALPRIPGEGSCAGAPPLVSRHRVLVAPSVSTWVTLAHRREKTTHAVHPGSLVVVADPVFSGDDPRLAEVVDAGGPGDGESGPVLRRLHASRREAEAILDRAAGPAKRLFGFDASKERILGGALRGHRYVHLATHATVDAVHPELSGIVLSHFDSSGRPQDGVVRTLDLFRLDLPAELVVLSACETALGAEIRGEGLVGLSRAFLAAGADNLLVSLWKVSDGGTATLMDAFYRGLLAEGLTPARALRSAQLEMQTHADFSEPYFWAGFVLVGHG